MADLKLIESRMAQIIVRQLGVEGSDISLDKSFMDDLGADSLDIVELVLAMEDEFGCEIPEEQVQKIRTVGDAVTFITANEAA